MSHHLMSYVTSSYVICHIILCHMSHHLMSYVTSSSQQPPGSSKRESQRRKERVRGVGVYVKRREGEIESPYAPGILVSYVISSYVICHIILCHMSHHLMSDRKSVRAWHTVGTLARAHARTRTCAHAHTPARAHAHTPTHPHAHTPTRPHAHTRTRTHANAHTRTRARTHRADWLLTSKPCKPCTIVSR